MADDDILHVRLKRLDEELHRRRLAEEELRHSRERLRLLVEHGGEVLYCLRLSPTRFEYISPVVAEMTGYTAGEFYANPALVHDIVHADERDVLRRFLESGDFHRPLTLRCLRRDGEVAWIEQRGVPSYDAKGRLIAIEGIARDVSEYRHLLEDLEHRAPSIEERERLVSAFQRIGSATIASLDLDHVLDTLAEQVVRAGIFRSLMVALTDQETRTIRVVRNYLSFEGEYEDGGTGHVRPGAQMTPSPTVARRDGERIVLSDQEIIGATYDLDDDNITPTVARTGQLTVIDGADERFDERFETRSSEDRAETVSYFIPICRDQRVLAVLATGSERSEKEETLRRIEVMEPLLEQAAVALDHALVHAHLRSHARELHDLNARLREEISRRERIEATLRDFSGRTVHLAEEERQRVARELHDGVNQLLCAVGFGLDSVSREVNGSATAQASLDHSRQVLDQTIREVRRISQNLRPGVLDDLGLAAAIRSLCDEFSERTGIPAVPDVSLLPDPLPAEVAITAYRLLQECLNLERHGTAAIRVRLTVEEGDLVSEVTDAGRVGRAEGDLGALQNLRDRADLLGGNLSLESIPEGGSRLTVRLPLRRHG